jgi:prevent-host-death family protein
MASRTIGLFEAKTHLSELVARAEQGLETVITRHSKPVARIVPLGGAPGLDVRKRREAVRRIEVLREELRSRHGSMTTEEIVGLVRAGRDDRSQRVLDAALRRSK